jgi:hypothetical protein
MKMYAPQEESYPNEQPSMWALFDLRLPGVAERLHRERVAWQEHSEIEVLDRDHSILIMYPGSAERSAA